jgi:phosphoglycerate dehydrogenase-like enzyme
MSLAAPPPRITFLDDDHVLRIARIAMTGLSPESTEWLERFFAPEVCDPESIVKRAQGARSVDRVEITGPFLDALPNTRDSTIIVFRRGVVDRATIEASPRLRLIQRLGARTDGIDMAAAAERSIMVSCLPRRVLNYTAEHAILLMSALSKKLFESDASVRAARFVPTNESPRNKTVANWTNVPGARGLDGLTLGLVGMGEVGTIVGALAKAFGMRVTYCNRRRLAPDQERALGVEFRPLPTLLEQSDVVSVHAAALPENSGIFGREAFRLMQRDALFINTSRGSLVDEDALFDALVNGEIAGAGLDVHADEPRPAGDRFFSLQNVILTPHNAGGSRLNNLPDLYAIFDNCRAALAGGPLPHARVF